MGGDTAACGYRAVGGDTAACACRRPESENLRLSAQRCVEQARDARADGVVVNLARGCAAQNIRLEALRSALAEAGFESIALESPVSDHAGVEETERAIAEFVERLVTARTGPGRG